VDAQHDGPAASRPSTDTTADPTQRPSFPRRLAVACRRRRWLPLALVAPLVLAGCQVPNFGAYKGATTQGHDAFKLWQGFTLTGIIVGGVVFLLIAWAALRYRRRSDRIPRQTQYRTLIEIVYTVLPVLVVIGLFAFTVITENEVDATPKPNVTIDVTAFQWGWQFYYPATGKVVEGETTQNPEMVIPVSERVRIQLRSADVVHDMYVPEFNFGRYAQPGHLNVFDFNALHTGVYRGQCSELCGLYHALMWFRVKVVQPAQFDSWVHQVSGQAASINKLKNGLKAHGPGA
jgi:cytochrome c oxidase subunit 2